MSTELPTDTPEFTMPIVLVPLVMLVAMAASTAHGSADDPRASAPPPVAELYARYLADDRTPVGKVGILFTGLIMPERLEQQPDLFYYLGGKPTAGTEAEKHPTALLDKVRFHEREPFTPTALVDVRGRTADSLGVPYLSKFRDGKLRWVPPKERLASGYFVDEGERHEWPAAIQKSTLNAQLWYYGVGLNPARMPHEAGVRHVVDLAMTELRRRYGPLEARQVNAPIPTDVERGVNELLDAGADTLVLVSTQVIHSGYKVLGPTGSFRMAIDAAERWRAKRDGKPVKIVMTEPMGHFKPMRDAFTALLEDRLDKVAPGTDVDVLLSSHGMAWDKYPNEVYPALAKPYMEGLVRDVEALLGRYAFGRTRVTVSQDLYADAADDPAGKYLSTNEAYRAAVADGYDLIITLPTTFYAESTDTLFGHAIYAFDGVPGYAPFATIDYPDWKVPFVREFRMGKTTILYNGLPVGPYAVHVADALVATVDVVLGRAGVARQAP
jgi:hypothetical protein